MRLKSIGRPGRFYVAILVLISCLVSPSPLQARQTAGTVRVIQVPAPSLAGNLVGTPTVQAAAIYLPPGYGTSPVRRYPVIYLLHGIFDSHRTWLGAVGLPAMLDRLIASHRLPAVIVVMPDGGNIYGGGYYRNSAVSGNWQDFLTRDLIGFVDRTYRTRADAEGRAAVGWSMGGYGALHLAMERPGTVSVVYAISPCCLAPVEDLGFGNDVWRRVVALRGPEDVEAARARGDFYATAAIGFLAAFDPAPGAGPFHVRFPFSFVRGEFVPDRGAVDRFTARFALNRLEAGAAGLRALNALGLDYGINDHFAHIPPSVAAFSSRLAQLSVPHRLDVYDGNHRDRVAERLESIVLPWVGAALDRPRGQPAMR